MAFHSNLSSDPAIRHSSIPAALHRLSTDRLQSNDHLAHTHTAQCTADSAKIQYWVAAKRDMLLVARACESDRRGAQQLAVGGVGLHLQQKSGVVEGAGDPGLRRQRDLHGLGQLHGGQFHRRVVHPVLLAHQGASFSAHDPALCEPLHQPHHRLSLVCSSPREPDPDVHMQLPRAFQRNLMNMTVYNERPVPLVHGSHANLHDHGQWLRCVQEGHIRVPRQMLLQTPCELSQQPGPVVLSESDPTSDGVFWTGQLELNFTTRGRVAGWWQDPAMLPA